MRFGLIKGQLKLARIWFLLHSWSVTSVTQHGSARDWTAVRMAEEPEPEPSWTAVDVSNDADGDGIPDYAHPLMLMVDADGDERSGVFSIINNVRARIRDEVGVKNLRFQQLHLTASSSFFVRDAPLRHSFGTA